jgi:hypothetical protein
MTRSLTDGRSLEEPIAQDEVDRQVAIWDCLVRYIDPWAKVATRAEHPALLRREYLAMHGVCHQAIAAAIAPLLSNGSDLDAALEPLTAVDWRISNPEWQGIAVQGRHISNTSTTIRNLAGLLGFKLGVHIDPGVAKSLVAAIKARGEEPPATLLAVAVDGG